MQRKKLKDTTPPDVLGKAHKWMSLAAIESVVGVAYDELNLFMEQPFIPYSYCRVGDNKWLLMVGAEPEYLDGKMVLWNDSILKARVRPDVAIINAKAKTYNTCGN